MRKVTITIEEEQYEWVREHHFNLSAVVRDKIEEMKQQYDDQNQN